MAPQPAILGGKPAITLDHSYYTQWPIYTEEEVDAVSDLIRKPRPRQPIRWIGANYRLGAAGSRDMGRQARLGSFVRHGVAAGGALRCRRRSR